MTKEEAISVIQEVFDNAELSHCGHYATALDMAIEALQGGDAEMSPIPNGTGVMQQSRHNDGRIEVVRCKDCKWYMLTDHNDTEVCTNKQWDISMAVYPIISADGFCSYGERSEK